jgi:O-antigen/teichoic acid export membrane protein
MSIKKDLVANYIGTGVSALAPILALPWYLSALGHKQWGLLSFVALLQGMLAIANSGMAQALVREFSNSGTPNSRVGELLVFFERIYWIFSIVAGVCLILLAEPISLYWLKFTSPSDLELAKITIRGGALLFVFQFPTAVYKSVLTSRGWQSHLNVISIFFVTLRHLGGVLVVSYFLSIQSYLILHITVTIFESIIFRYFTWRKLDFSHQKNQLKLSEDIRLIFKSSTWLSVCVLISLVTMHMDKLIISWNLPIEQLGYYTIATSLGFGVLQIFNPIATTMLPRLIESRNNPVLRKIILRRILKINLIIIFLIFAGFILFGNIFLDFWLKDTLVSHAIYPALGILLLGTCLNALYNIEYMNWITDGNNRKILSVNIVAFLCVIIVMPNLIKNYGIIGASFGWVLINIIGLIFSIKWNKNGRKTA